MKRLKVFVIVCMLLLGVARAQAGEVPIGNTPAPPPPPPSGGNSATAISYINPIAHILARLLLRR